MIDVDVGVNESQSVLVVASVQFLCIMHKLLTKPNPKSK